MKPGCILHLLDRRSLSARAHHKPQSTIQNKAVCFPSSLGLPSNSAMMGPGGSLISPTQTFQLFSVPAPSCSSGKSCFCPFPTFIQEEPQQCYQRQSVFGSTKQEAARIEGWCTGVLRTEGFGSGGRGFAAIWDKIQWFSSALAALFPASAPQPHHPCVRKCKASTASV